MNIAFIGVGVMGRSMVRNLLSAGFAVSVYTRTRSKAEEVVRAGAIWADSIAACVREADAIITIVGYPKDVEEVYWGEGGIFACARPGAVLIDMTTSSPELAVRIFEEAQARGLSALDAPVSGGDTGAKNGTLAIMAGGEQSAFDRAMPILQAMGKNIRLEGPAGSGQHTKMANQIAIAGALAGVCEALSYAKAAGLDGQALLDTISTGAAGSWQLSNNAPKMLARDFAPAFYIKHFIKDMRLAGQEADRRNRPLPVLSTVLALFEELARDGYEDEGTQALIRAYETK